MKVHGPFGAAERQSDDTKMEVTAMATGWDGLGCRLGLTRIGSVSFGSVRFGGVRSAWLVGG